MKKKLSLLLVAFMAIAAFAGLRRAAAVEIDFSKQRYANAQDVSTEPLTVGGVTISFSQGTNRNAPKYYDTGTAIRLYGGNTMTVSSQSDLEKIEFTFSSGEGTNAITTDNGEYSDGIWTGKANSVTFTVDGTSGHRRVAKLAVTLAASGGDDPDPQEGEEKTVTFINDANWEHVYVHAWNNDGNITGEWPGVEITLTEGAYTWTTTANPTGIIFNNGNNGQQTSDYEFADGATYNTKGRLYTYTATFTTTADWESVYAYAWSGDGAAKKEFIGSWPGTPIEEVNGVYTVTITDTEAPTKIIFNNGNSGEGNQTEDLDFVNGKRYNYFQTGSADNPLTIAQAIAAIDAGIPTSIEVFVKGIVSKVESFNDKYSSITYWISDDGESQQFEVYSGKGLNGANFTSIDDVKVGANVVIKGSIKKYRTTYEFDVNNELVKYEAPAQELNTYTATFINTGRWNEVYAYAWSGDGETAVKFLGDWPGTKLNINDQTGMYEVTIEAAEAPQKIIFNDGANTKTEDLVFENGGRYSYVEPQTQKYTIYVDDGMVNGTVVPNKTEAAEGEEVILTVKPHEGFELETLTVTAGQETTITVTDGKFTMPAADVFVSATFKEAEALVINSMAIVGDFTGGWPFEDKETGEWDWSMAKPMTHIDEQPAIWALEIKGFEAEAKTYEFKAAANGKYGDYDLPAQGNKGFTFGTDMYPAGKYDLLFKADTEHHELNLYATKVEEPQPDPELIVVGNNADIFGAAWDTESTANTLEFKAGKYYRTYQNVQPQEANIELKAYNKANGKWFGDINNNGGNIVFNMKETGDFTVVLDVNADFTEGYVWVDGDNVIYPEPQPQPTSKEVTMKYTGTTTTNMTGGNDAELLGLDESEWSVIGDKGSSNNLPGLNRDGTMRLYWNTNGSNTITVSSLSNATINSITLDLKTNYNKICVKVGDNIISGTNGTYAINSSSFVLGNANTSNVQVHIKSVTINYTEGTPELKTFTATFTTNADWEKVYAYAWSGTEGQEDFKMFLGDWPGTELTKNDEGVYTVTVTDYKRPGKIIFNNGADQQTEDLDFRDGKHYLYIMKGTVENPITIAQAIKALDLESPINEVYVQGIVSDKIEELFDNSYITYWISTDGTTNGQQFMIERGGDYLGQPFKSIDDIEVGAKVVVNGRIEKYVDERQGIIEYKFGNYDGQLVKYEPLQNFTASFTTDQGWEKVYAYAWTGEEPNVQEHLGSWPGTDISNKYNDNTNAYDLSFRAYEAPEYIIFNNGLEGDAQQKTKNLVFENGKTYEYTAPQPTTFTITVAEGIANGTVTTDKAEAEAGETVSLTVTPAEGYELEKLEVRDAEQNAVEIEKDNSFIMPASNVTIFASFKKAAVKIEGMAIVGDFTGGWPIEDKETGEEDWSMAKAMTHIESQPEIWTLEIKGFEAEAKTYEYKAAANNNWNDYVLPNGANAKFQFGTDEYPAGKYDLFFKADTQRHQLNLYVTKSEEPQPEDVYIVAGNKTSIFGGEEAWAISDANEMELIEGKYLKTYTVQDAMEGVELKVIKNGNTWIGDKDGQNVKFDLTGAGEFTVVLDLGGENNGIVWVEGDIVKKSEPVQNTYTTTFKTNAGWNEVYAYAWTTKDGATTEFLGGWPGTKLSSFDGIYALTFTATEAPEKIIFNNGNGGEGNQTADLAFENGKAYEYIVEVPQPLLGDANLNGEVTTSDAVLAVSFALKKVEPTPEQFLAANVDKDNEITVADAKGIVNIALEIEPESEGNNGNHAIANSYLTLDGQTLNLMNAIAFAGFQMDVTLADGALLNGAELADRAAGMMLGYNRISDNTWRIVALSLDETTMSGNEGALLKLDIFGNSNISVSNILFVDAAARAYRLDFMGETTGINSVKSISGDADIYNVNGVRTNTTSKGVNIIRNANGKVQKVFVK